MNREYLPCDPEQWVDVEGLSTTGTGSTSRAQDSCARARTSTGDGVGHVHLTSATAGAIVAMLRTDFVRGGLEPHVGPNGWPLRRTSPLLRISGRIITRTGA